MPKRFIWKCEICGKYQVKNNLKKVCIRLNIPYLERKWERILENETFKGNKKGGVAHVN